MNIRLPDFCCLSAAGWILVPFSRDMVPMVHINRIGVILKSTPGKYQLIVYLSYPKRRHRQSGDTYIDTVLLFGLLSALKIFDVVADVLEWFVSSNGVPEVFHYLDDFLVVGTPGLSWCANELATLIR